MTDDVNPNPNFDPEHLNCPWSAALLARADCGRCQGTACDFHIGEGPTPCDCSIELRHKPTREPGDGYVTSSGYEVGTHKRAVDAMVNQTGTGDMRAVVEGGSHDGHEFVVPTVGTRAPVTLKLGGVQYRRKDNRPRQADLTWVYVPDDTRDRLRGDRPANLTVPPFSQVLQDVPLPPPIEGRTYRSGEKRPPGAPPPLQPSMGGRLPVPDEELPAGKVWARHTTCDGTATIDVAGSPQTCRGCEGRGWVPVDEPKPRPT